MPCQHYHMICAPIRHAMIALMRYIRLSSAASALDMRALFCHYFSIAPYKDAADARFSPTLSGCRRRDALREIAAAPPRCPLSMAAADGYYAAAPFSMREDAISPCDFRHFAQFYYAIVDSADFHCHCAPLSCRFSPVTFYFMMPLRAFICHFSPMLHYFHRCPRHFSAAFPFAADAQRCACHADCCHRC